MLTSIVLYCMLHFAILFLKTYLLVIDVSFMYFLSSQEKAKYLFSFNFVALNFVLPQLEQVSCLNVLILHFILHLFYFI